MSLAPSVEQLNDAFIDAQQWMNPVIADDTKQYLNLYRNRVPRGQFEYGRGYVMQAHTFFGGTAIQDAGASWSEVIASRPPNPATQDPGHDACKYDSEVIGYGFLTREHRLYQATRRTLDICLTDILFKWQYERQMELTYQMLSNVTLGEWEQILRECYIYLANKYIALNDNAWGGLGLGTFTLTAHANGITGSTVAKPAGGFDTIGTLNQRVLDRIYALLSRQAGRYALKMVNGKPIFGLVTSSETSEEIIREDATIREDVRNSSRADILIDGVGPAFVYRGYTHIHDPHAPRFRVSADGTELERVYPFATSAATIGEQVNVDPEYIKAPFEVSVIWLENVYRCLVPPANPSNLSGRDFDPVENWGEFFWLNIRDRANNLLREKGFFFARMRMSPEPLAAYRDAVVILHRRPQDIALDYTAPVDAGTAGAKAVSAAAKYISTDADADATLYEVTLASNLNKGVGEEVTVTFAGALTATATIYAEADAPTYVLAFAAGTAGGWAAYDGGMSTVA